MCRFRGRGPQVYVQPRLLGKYILDIQMRTFSYFILLALLINSPFGYRKALAWSEANTLTIPPTIIAEARRLRIPSSAIRLLKGRWVACLKNENSHDTCLDLGAFGVPSEPWIDNKPHVTVYPPSEQLKANALPQYRREAPRLVRTSDCKLVVDYVDNHPHEPFLVLVTVPGLCEPCRRMDETFRQFHATSPLHAKVKTFILEYQTFEEAQSQLLCAGATFPTTLAFGPVTAGRTSPSLVIGNASGQFISELSLKLRAVFKRGAPNGIAQGYMSSDSVQYLVTTAR